jgi:TonB family protein
MNQHPSRYRFQLPDRRGKTWRAAGSSLILHALLIAAAVNATAIAARTFKEEIARQIAYLPPPNRRPNSEAMVEHLQYIELGGGVQALETKLSSDRLQLVAGTTRELPPGGDLDRSLANITSSIKLASPDSIYSEIEVEERAERVQGSGAPAYPAELMRQRIEGSALARFVVDTMGHAEPASIRIVSTTHEPFAESVRKAIPNMVFRPATVAGHTVRQAVEQNFRFRLPPVVAPKSKP